MEEGSVSCRVVRWVAPSEGTVKLNFDGGLSQQRGCAVAGGIFRDHNGVPLFSYGCADPVLVGSTPYDGEVKALAMGLNHARNLGFNDLWVEGDAQFLIDAVAGRRANKWYDQRTVEFIQRRMNKFPKKPALSWVAREGNSAADALVKHMRNNDVSAKTWDRTAKLPETVVVSVLREQSGYSYVRHLRHPRGCYRNSTHHVKPHPTTFIV